MNNQIYEQIAKAKDDFRKYWNLENEKPLVTVKAIQDINGLRAVQQKHRKDLRYRNCFMSSADPSAKLDGQVESSQYMYYTGSSMPMVDSGLCVGVSAGFLGNVLNFDNNGKTIWQDHNYAERELSEIDFSEDNVWWVIQKNLVKSAVEKAHAHNLPLGLPVDMFSGMDSLMLLRGTENLCLDLMLEPDMVKEACTKIHKWWKEWIDAFFAMSAPKIDGNCVTWLNIWGEGRTFCIQSDFMSLISTDMYEEFVMPGILDMCENLDHVLFHFDGPDHVKRHLPFLLETKKIEAIQWNPARNYENVRHLDTLREIQKAGKRLILNTTVSELEELVTSLDPRGVLLNVDPFDAAKTPEEADEIVNMVNKLS